MIDPIGRFTSPGHTDLEKDADLAIFLIDFLESRRDSASGSWPGERETRRLQNTCHAIEALSDLNLGLISGRMVEAGLKWLVDLPLLRDVLPQDRRIIRIYPMRFKTLAMLNRFDSPQVQKDFAELGRYYDAHSGFLTDVPGEFSRVMNTMVWVDTLLFLEHHAAPPALWQNALDLGLNTLETALDKWLVDPFAQKDMGDIRGVREVSYAFELLARGGRLPPESEKGRRIEEELIKACTGGRPDRLRMALYYGLQLATHFPGRPEARAAAGQLVREVRTRYESGSHAGQPDYFHAIVLRLLSACHRDRLRETILETLWLRNQQTIAREHDSPEQKRRAALRQLIHQHVQVNLGQVVRLSGTRTRAAVYRVHFSLQSDATDKDGHAYAIVPGSLQLIIKQGSIESLSRTIRRYRELPDELRRYFAHHSDQAETAGDDWYLTMEDLVGMTPLSEVLDRLELRWVGRAEHDQMMRVAIAIARTLGALHQHRRRTPVASNQLGWIYLTPISEAINTLCEPNALPEIKAYVANGFEGNGCAYERLNAYLERLQPHAARLTPPAISGVHGDCHSRNLMIDGDLAKVKFVDLETLSYADDYLTDYGLLIEDVALYRFLPRGQRPEALALDEITADPDRVQYPALPRGADSILFFQNCLLEQMAAFAGAAGDPHFKPRLWLATVRNLIQLAARQLPLTDPHRRDEILKLSVVVYAEAVRLLHELAQHLEGAPLPDLPFTGQTRAV
jgi:hypothetical protein